MNKTLEEILKHIDDDEIRNLFLESDLCYRSNAYRASLMMAWLGFMKLVRARLLVSGKPKELDEKKWKGIEKNLYQDELWEKATFEATQREDNTLLKIKDNIREELRYWRTKRNDVAHAKSSTITVSLVDTFFIFILDNIFKISTIESAEQIISELDTHFDPVYTRHGESCSHIIQKIPYAISIDEIEDFLDKLNKEFWLFRDDELNIITTEILNLNLSVDYQNKIIQKILSDDGWLFPYLSSSPQKLTTFFKKNEFRPFWKTKLKDHPVERSCYDLIKHIHDIGYILDSETEEFWDIMLSKISSRIPDDLVEFFKEWGYTKYFLEKAFEASGGKVVSYDWINKYHKILVQIMLVEKITFAHIKKLSIKMSNDNYSWSLKKYLIPPSNDEATQFIEKIKIIADSNNFELSDNILLPF